MVIINAYIGYSINFKSIVRLVPLIQLASNSIIAINLNKLHV